mgnify:CR=1 FL=1
MIYTILYNVHIITFFLLKEGLLMTHIRQNFGVDFKKIRENKSYTQQYVAQDAFLYSHNLFAYCLNDPVGLISIC